MGVAASRHCPACNGYGWRRTRKGEQAFDPYVHSYDADPARAKDKREAGWRWDEQERKDKQRHLDRVLAELQRNEKLRNGQLDTTERFAWEVTGAILRSSEPMRQVITLLKRYEALHGRVENLDEFAEWAAERWKGPLDSEGQSTGGADVQRLAAKGWKKKRIAQHTGLSLWSVKKILRAAA